MQEKLNGLVGLAVLFGIAGGCTDDTTGIVGSEVAHQVTASWQVFDSDGNVLLCPDIDGQTVRVTFSREGVGQHFSQEYGCGVEEAQMQIEEGVWNVRLELLDSAGPLGSVVFPEFPVRGDEVLDIARFKILRKGTLVLTLPTNAGMGCELDSTIRWSALWFSRPDFAQACGETRWYPGDNSQSFFTTNCTPPRFGAFCMEGGMRVTAPDLKPADYKVEILGFKIKPGTNGPEDVPCWKGTHTVRVRASGLRTDLPLTIESICP